MIVVLARGNRVTLLLLLVYPQVECNLQMKHIMKYRYFQLPLKFFSLSDRHKILTSN